MRVELTRRYSGVAPTIAPIARSCTLPASIAPVLDDFARNNACRQRGWNRDIGRDRAALVDPDGRRRRLYIARRRQPDGLRYYANRRGQEEIVLLDINRRRRRAPPARRRRVDNDRRLMHHKIARARIFKKDDLLARWRRKRVVNHNERGGRLLRRRKTRQPSARLVGIRTFGIARKIGPISIGRVDVERAAPCARLAPRRQHVAHVFGVGAVAIGCEKLLVGGDIIAIQRGCVCILRRHLRNRQRTTGFHTLRGDDRRRRVGSALQHHNVLRQAAFAPRRLRALRQFGHAGANACKHLVNRQARLAQHFSQCLRIGAVRRLGHRRNRARRRVEGDQRIGFRLNHRQPRRQRRPAFRERRRIGDVERKNAPARRQPRQGAREIGNAHGVQRQIGFTLHAGAGRDEIILALRLHAITRHINGGHGIGPGCGHFLQKFTIGRAQSLLIEIAGAGHFKPGGLVGVGHKAGVVGGGGKLAVLIIIVADDEREPRLPGLRRRLCLQWLKTC